MFWTFQLLLFWWAREKERGGMERERRARAREKEEERKRGEEKREGKEGEREKECACKSEKQCDNYWTPKLKFKGCSEVKHTIFEVRLHSKSFWFWSGSQIFHCPRKSCERFCIAFNFGASVVRHWENFFRDTQPRTHASVIYCCKHTTSKLSGLYVIHYYCSQVYRPSGGYADLGQAQQILAGLAHVSAVN